MSSKFASPQPGKNIFPLTNYFMYSQFTINKDNPSFEASFIEIISSHWKPESESIFVHKTFCLSHETILKVSGAWKQVNYIKIYERKVKKILNVTIADENIL